MNKLFALCLFTFLSFQNFAQTQQQELDKINRFLTTFDNGYYGPLIIENEYLYCTIKDGRKSKIPLSSIDKAVVMKNEYGAKILCTNGSNCVTGVNGSMYGQISFRTTKSFDRNKLAYDLNQLIYAIKRESNEVASQTPTNTIPQQTTNTAVSYSKTDKRVALIFGNSNYTNSSKLGANPINDANDIATTLRGIGFDVILKTDASLYTMNNAIREFGRQNRDADVVLFYFAGHGLQLEKENYLVPVNASIQTKNDVAFECINVNTVQGIMETSNADRLNLIVLDACRNNPFRSWERGGETGLADMTPPSGTLIAYATSPGSTASNGNGRNGLYTGELIKQLKKSQRIEDVFINTRIEVENKSGGQQSPWELARLRGKYFLVK